MARSIYYYICFIFLLSALGCKPGTAPARIEAERITPPTTEAPNESEQDSTLLADLGTLQTSVQAAPENATVRFDYLTALDRSGKYDEALAQARALGAIQQRNPFRSAAYLTFARIVLDNIPKNDPGRNDLVKEAIDHIKVALDLDPGSVPSHLVLGRLALETGDKETVLHHLAIASTATEIGSQLRISMAEIYIEKKDFMKARAHLDAAKPLAEKADDKTALHKIQELLSRAG